MPDDTQPRVLIPRAEIASAVGRLAEEIGTDYEDENPLLVGVLKGSFVFLADLIRRLGFPLEVDFIGVSSYGAGTESSGEIEVTAPLRADARGRHVLVVEDIVDTGLTTRFVLDHIREQGPASLRLCALLDKPSRRRTLVEIHYLGFEIPDRFVVGYGVDWNERFRHLPDICFIEGEEESHR